jgi:hypothetical protein
MSTGSLLRRAARAAAVAQTTTRMSVSTGGAQGNAASEFASISADAASSPSPAPRRTSSPGTRTPSRHLRPRPCQRHDRARERGFGGAQADDDSYGPVISADGRYVAFPSAATNLVLGDSNAVWDIFVRDRQLGTTERVSVASNGRGQRLQRLLRNLRRRALVPSRPTRPTSRSGTRARPTTSTCAIASWARPCARASRRAGGGERPPLRPAISADGRFVAFQSNAADFVLGDTNNTGNLRARLLTGTTSG